MLESEWQTQIVDLAHLNGWRHLHVRRSIGRGQRWTTTTNVVGWPDLLLWHESDQRVLAIELKVGKNAPTVEQIEVLGSLRAAGIETAILWPDMLDEAVELLARRRPSSALRSGASQRTEGSHHEQ